jgi:ADP-ribose pyrophosphatase YjhB (NUDIX family)
VKVKVRAVIVRDGRLLVSREFRQGIEHILLPGGRVRDGESITDALIRELAEETGLAVVPQRLLYVAEVVGMYGVHDLNLVWLAELSDPQVAISDNALVGLDSPQARAMMPPIIEQIAADATNGWPQQARWLGNVRRAAGDSTT